MTSQIADFVVSLGSGGRVLSQGSLAKALKHNAALLSQAAKEIGEPELSGDELSKAGTESQERKGKLMMKEEISEGHVGFQARKSGVSPFTPSIEDCISEDVVQEHGWRPSASVLVVLPWELPFVRCHLHTSSLVAWRMGNTIRAAYSFRCLH